MTVTVFEFGRFRLDCERFELCRDGRSLKLERKPMELLILLAASDGRLVTRAEIAERLWGSEVFVDTEHGINTAIRKIRQALHDDPEAPRFVQTVTGKGYRFISSIVEVPSSPSTNGSGPEIAGVIASPIQNLAVHESIANHTTASEPKTPLLRQARLRRWLVAIGTLAALAILIIAISRGMQHSRDRAGTAKPEIQSLAVLPLDNLSGDPGQNYFADGMTDELTTMLAKNSTLRVVSRTSAMQYKGVHRPLREIARELGVDGVLEGSIERAGNKVHMNIQLIQAPSDTHLWAESYDRDADNVVSLPREAALTIAKRLDSSTPQPVRVRYVSPEAHDAYLRGRYLWFTGSNEEAGKYFRKATDLQPDYAAGWAGLSTYYGQGALEGDLKPEDSLAQEEEAASKAVELDDSLPEGHLALGAAIFLHRRDSVRAERELARAIELNPGFAEAWHFRSKVLVAVGRYEEAIASEKKAMELDPFQRPFAMGLAYLSARQYDAAISDVRMRLETVPQDVGLHWILCESYRRKGMLKQAEEEWEKILLLQGETKKAATIRHTWETGGYKALLLLQVSDLEQKSAKQYVSPVAFAFQYAQLNRREETLASLEAGYRERSPLLLWIQDDPAYDFLHAEERYHAIIRGMGMPPAY